MLWEALNVKLNRLKEKKNKLFPESEQFLRSSQQKHTFLLRNFYASNLKIPFRVLDKSLSRFVKVFEKPLVNLQKAKKN